MPFIRLQTNIAVEDSARHRLIREASSLIARMLNKPEPYVMVSVETECDMLFGGNDTPLAYVELKSIGLPGDQTTRYSETLCAFIARELKIPQERVYIEFADVERNLWGWNAKTFQR